MNKRIYETCPKCKQKLQKRTHGVNFVWDTCWNADCKNFSIKFNKIKRTEWYKQRKKELETKIKQLENIIIMTSINFQTQSQTKPKISAETFKNITKNPFFEIFKFKNEILAIGKKPKIKKAFDEYDKKTYIKLIDETSTLKSNIAEFEKIIDMLIVNFQFQSQKKPTQTAENFVGKLESIFFSVFIIKENIEKLWVCQDCQEKINDERPKAKNNHISPYLCEFCHRDRLEKNPNYE